MPLGRTDLSKVHVWRLSGLAVALAVLFSGFAVAFQAEAYASGSDIVRIMPLGDSITRGDTKYLNGAWNPDPVGYRQKLYVDLMDSGYSLDFVGSLSDGGSANPAFDTNHEGWGGVTASWINSNLYSFLSAGHPDIVLYHIGTNSLYSDNVGQAAFDADQSLRLLYAFDPDITVVLAKIIRTTNDAQNVRTHSYNLLIEQYAQSWSAKGYSILVVDMENVLIPTLRTGGGDFVDTVHPTELGYRKMATVWYNALNSILSSMNLQPPNAAFSFSPSTPYVYDTVSFDASSSSSVNGAVASYNWNFGDGSTTVSASSGVTHRYTSSGTIVVQLSVTDSSGLTDSTEKSLTVLQDNRSPTTTHNYDFSWHVSDFTIDLHAEDDESGVAATYYRINAGTIRTLSANGQPHITTEGAANTLEYWSIDAAGNEELPHKMLNLVKLDKTAPTGTILINEGTGYTTSSSLNLTLTASDALSGVKQVRFSNDGVWDSETWEPFSRSRTWTLTSGEGRKGVYYQVQDNAGLVSTYKEEVVSDTSLPTGSIIINSGEAYADSTSVRLTLAATDVASGVKQIRFSNDAIWDNEMWETPTSTKTWELSSAQGLKTVYYQIMDYAGHTSNTYTDTIMLDTSRPSGSITINGGDPFVTSTGVTLTLQGIDTTAGVSQIRLSNDGVWDSETWEAPTSSKTWVLTIGDVMKTVYYQMVDNAGLLSDVYADTIILDTTPPAGSIVIGGGAYTNSSTVTLVLTAADATSGAYQIRLSNDGVWDTESWEAQAVSKNWTMPAGEGAKTVYYQIRDNANLVSSTYSDTIVLDATAPTGSIIINDGATFTNVSGVHLALNATDAGSGISQMRFSNDEVVWSSWEPYSDSKSWSLQNGEGVKKVLVQYKDVVDLIATVSQTITLDETPPIANAGGSMMVTVSTGVTFNGGSSTDNTGVASYFWDFGDGSTGTGATPTHDFGRAGQYTATLTVVDLAGNRSVASAASSIEVTILELSLILLMALVLASIAAIALFYRKSLLKGPRKETELAFSPV